MHSWSGKPLSSHGNIDELTYNSKFSDGLLLKNVSEMNNTLYLTENTKSIINIINISQCLGKMFVSSQIQCSDTWWWPHGEVIRLRGGRASGPPMMESASLEEEEEIRALSPNERTQQAVDRRCCLGSLI